MDALSIYLDYHKDLRTPVIYLEFYNATKICCKVYPSGTFKYTDTDYRTLRDEEYEISTFAD